MEQQEHITAEELLSFILLPIKYEYESYDHSAAIEEYKSTRDLDLDNIFMAGLPNCHNMPKELKEKYKIKRIGKLRQIDIAPKGHIWRVRIGHRYAKTYYMPDIGTIVKPILTKKQDKHNLVIRGLAILNKQ